MKLERSERKSSCMCELLSLGELKIRNRKCVTSLQVQLNEAERKERRGIRLE